MFKQIAEYENLIINWADERGIIEHSTPLSQLLKCASQVGELADAIAKGEDVIDHIGNTLVTLVLEGRVALGPDFSLQIALCALDDPYFDSVEEFEFKKAQRFIELGGDHLEARIGAAGVTINQLGKLADAIARAEVEDTLVGIGKMIHSLIALAVFHDLTLARCLDHAWNEIKDHKGHMSEGGVFVKDEPAKAVIAQCEVSGALGIGQVCEYWNNTREICALGVEHGCPHLEIEDAE